MTIQQLSSVGAARSTARPAPAAPAPESAPPAVADGFEASPAGPAPAAFKSPLLNPTSQFLLGMAVSKSLLQGVYPSPLTRLQMGVDSADHGSQVKANVWQNSGYSNVNSSLQGNVDGRSFNAQQSSFRQADGTVRTDYGNPYSDFGRDRGTMVSRQDGNATVTQLDGVLGNREAHLCSRLELRSSDDGNRHYALTTTGTLGGQEYRSDSEFVVRPQAVADPAGGMPLLGSVSTSGTEGGQAFTATESWRAYKSHPVLNEVVVDGQGQAGAAFQVTHGQFTVRDDFNPALSINRLLN